MIDCRPSEGIDASATLAEEQDMDQLQHLVDEFSNRLPGAL